MTRDLELLLNTFNSVRVSHRHDGSEDNERITFQSGFRRNKKFALSNVISQLIIAK